MFRYWNKILLFITEIVMDYKSTLDYCTCVGQLSDKLDCALKKCDYFTVSGTYLNLEIKCSLPARCY